MVQHIKLSDFISGDWNNNSNYSAVFREMDALHKKIQWSISQFKVSELDQRSGDLKRIINPSIIKKEFEEYDSKIERHRNSFEASKSRPSQITQKIFPPEILNRLDKEAIKLIDRNPEGQLKLVRNCSGKLVHIGSRTQSTNSVDSTASSSLAPVTTKLTKGDLFTANPITNYYNYNVETNEKHIDERRCESNPKFDQLFKKYNCKKSSVELTMCFEYGCLKGLKAPVKLTEQMKKELKLDLLPAAPIRKNKMK